MKNFDKTLATKFRVKVGQKILLVNPPFDFKFANEVKISSTLKPDNELDAIFLFVNNLKELQKYFKNTVKHLGEDKIFWLFYPKSSSSIKPDINRDVILNFLKEFPVKILTLVSYDENWAAFLIRKIKPEELIKKSEEKDKFYPYIDFEKRIVTPPDDFLKVLKKSKKAFEKFQKLSFTHKKEYVQAILEAKKPETRKRRIEQALKSLSQ